MSVHTQTHAACGLEKPGYSWFRWRKGEAMEISPGRGSLEKGSEETTAAGISSKYSFSLLGLLHALIWGLSAAFICFSSAGSPGLRGN